MGTDGWLPSPRGAASCVSRYRQKLEQSQYPSTPSRTKITGLGTGLPANEAGGRGQGAWLQLGGVTQASPRVRRGGGRGRGHHRLLLLPLPPRGECVNPARMLLQPGFKEKPNSRLSRGKGEGGGVYLPRLSSFPSVKVSTQDSDSPMLRSGCQTPCHGARRGQRRGGSQSSWLTAGSPGWQQPGPGGPRAVQGR